LFKSLPIRFISQNPSNQKQLLPNNSYQHLAGHFAHIKEDPRTELANIFVFFHKLDSCFLAGSASKDETITKEGRGQANSGQEVVTDTEQLLNAADEYKVHSIDVA